MLLSPSAYLDISTQFFFSPNQYLIMNLGMSENFGTVDLAHLPFPTKMRVDWIRVYQPKDAINIGCDPKDFPTASYISQYVVRYRRAGSLSFVIFQIHRSVHEPQPHDLGR